MGVGSQQMQAQRAQVDFRPLRRALGLLGRSWQVTLAAYVALLLSTGAQLWVPQLVQNVLDTVVQGVAVRQIVQLPAEGEGLDPLGMTAAEFEQRLSDPLAPLYWGVSLILFLSVIRGLFAFAQSYLSEKAGQEVAFDMRNDLFAKIQRLSFSYHDRNRTGQLMIRATDDIEKVRLFLGQGLLLSVQALVLLIGTLILLVLTNLPLTLVVLP
ncbi:MAG: ABC transporter transmembrane domain-containing protein, partial [Caldilinea sp.]